MRKFFYKVQFEYMIDEYYKSSFDLGIFSCKQNAEEKVKRSCNLAGFRDYSLDNFSIVKFAVDMDEDCDKSSAILYELWHEYSDISQDCLYWTIFGYYSSKKRAEERLCNLRSTRRIGKKYPNNFEISEVKVDNYNAWSEGFEKTP